MASMTLTLSAADASPPPRTNVGETSGVGAILALDLGTTTGWAFRNLRGRILSGTAEFKPHRFEGGGMRYLRFERWLDETLRLAGDVEAVYFEEVRRHVGVDAAHAYGVSSPGSPPGARNTPSPIRASQLAPSSGSSPVRATPTRQR